jgi:hypothetical protein
LQHAKSEDNLPLILQNLLLSYKSTVKESNTNQCPWAATGPLLANLPFVYAHTQNRPNIPSEDRLHDPDNFYNKGKGHFYRLWCKPDFDCDPWCGSLVFSQLFSLKSVNMKDADLYQIQVIQTGMDTFHNSFISNKCAK